MNEKLLEEFKNLYTEIKPGILARLDEFKNVWKHGADEDVFLELAFCIFTPQSKAKECWKTVLNLKEKGLLFTDEPAALFDFTNNVRFKYKKSEYLVEVKKHFFKNGRLEIKKVLGQFDDVFILRDWLVSTVKGYGYKEASHFMRNIGFGKDIAILDRHILRCLHQLEIIDNMPSSMTKKSYMELESRMKKFSDDINIGMDHLDILFWYKATGEIFK